MKHPFQGRPIFSSFQELFETRVRNEGEKSSDWKDGRRMFVSVLIHPFSRKRKGNRINLAFSFLRSISLNSWIERDDLTGSQTCTFLRSFVSSFLGWNQCTKIQGGEGISADPARLDPSVLTGPWIVFPFSSGSHFRCRPCFFESISLEFVLGNKGS